MSGLYGGLDYEHPLQHLRNFTVICSPFSFKNVSQESIRLKLFPLSLMREASKWFFELPKNSITSWYEPIISFKERYFTPYWMMKLRD